MDRGAHMGDGGGGWCVAGGGGGGDGDVGVVGVVCAAVVCSGDSFFAYL